MILEPFPFFRYPAWFTLVTKLELGSKKVKLGLSRWRLDGHIIDLYPVFFAGRSGQKDSIIWEAEIGSREVFKTEWKD